MPRNLIWRSAQVLTAASMVLAIARLPAAAVGAPELPTHDQTPVSMFLGADIVVKCIMSILAVASLVTWALAIAKTIEIGIARRRVQAALATLARCTFLTETQALQQTVPGIGGRLVDEALAETALNAGGGDRSAVETRIASRLADVEEAAGRDIRAGTGILATIGSTSPFVGLLGTVWGIMNSFIGISATKTTNLAVVAPGIAEALLATAIGLVAAIPAVVVYNILARKIGAYRALVRRLAAEIARLASRDLDRRSAGPRRLHLAAE